MRTYAAWLAVAVALAVGAGIGVYLAVGGGGSGAALPPVPKAHQSPPLERATAEGIIPGYRAVRGQWGVYRYEVPGGIALTFPNACGYRSCPGSTPVIQIEYRHSAAAQARRVLALTQQWAKHTFKPPQVLLPGETSFHPEGVGYRLKFFEITG